MDQIAARACFIVERLMIDLTSVPATQNPSRPMMVCAATMAVVTAAAEGGLLSPARECALRGPSVQNGINHKRMSDTPTRRRNGDTSADSGSLAVDAPWRISDSQPVLWALGSAVFSHTGTTLCDEHKRSIRPLAGRVRRDQRRIDNVAGARAGVPRKRQHRLGRQACL